MSRNHNLAKNTVLLGFSKITTQMLVFLLIPIYTKYLNPKDFGSVDLIMTYVTLIVPFLTVQLEMAAFRFALENRKNEKVLSEIFSNILSIVIPITFIAISIMTIASFFIKINYLLIIILNIISSVVSSILLQYSRGLGRIKVFTIANIVASLSTVVTSSIFIIWLRIGASSIILSAILSNIIIISYISFAINIKKYIGFNFIKDNTRNKLLSYSLPLVPNNLSWWIINISDRTIISIFLGFIENGIYAISYKLAFIPGIIFGIFNMSWSESSALNIKSKDKDIYFTKIFNSALVFYSSITAIFIAFIPILLPYIISEPFSQAYNFIPILAFASLNQALLGLYSSIYIAIKNTKQVTKTTIYAALLNILMNLLLIKFIGLYASAFSTFFSLLLILIHRHLDTQKYVKINYDKIIILKITILFIFITLNYYMRNNFLNIASIVFTLISTFLLNRKLILKLLSIAIENYFNKFIS